MSSNVNNIMNSISGNIKENLTSDFADNFVFELFLDNTKEAPYREIVNKYKKEFSKDKHKVNYAFKKEKGSIGMPYILAFKKGERDPAAWTCYDVVKDGNGKIGITTHCLSVRPGYRGNRLSEVMLSILEKAVVEKFHPDYTWEICNEVSTRSYKKIGLKETGSFRMTKSGERCLIRLRKEYEK